MRQAGICLWLMIKRMGKHPVYWVLLLLFPTAFFVVPFFNKAVNEKQILAGYVMEEEKGRTEAESGEQEYRRQLLNGIESRLLGNYEEMTGQKSEQRTENVEIAGREEKGGKNQADGGDLFRYIKYTDTDELKKGILTGEVSCGFVFHEDFAEKLLQQDYRHCITLYLPEGMNAGGMAQEDVFAKIYQAYSAVWYAELLEQRGYQMEPEEILRKFSEYQMEGKVFAVSYEKQDGKAKKGGRTAESENGVMSALSLRGVLAFLTLLSASLGALDESRDRARGMGTGMSDQRRLASITAGAPILPAALFLAAGMLLDGYEMYLPVAENGRGAMLVWALSEIGSALLYGVILWLSAVFFSKYLPEKWMEDLMPCFLLTVLLCCPIFLNLGEMVPLIGYLSNCFPVTWYLEFWS